MRGKRAHHENYVFGVSTLSASIDSYVAGWSYWKHCAQGRLVKPASHDRGEQTKSISRQVFGGKDEPLDPFSGRNRFDYLWHIRYCDSAVEKMIGFDQDADATRALVKAARCANARGDRAESARAELLFQRPVHFFRTSSRA